MRTYEVSEMKSEEEDKSIKDSRYKRPPQDAAVINTVSRDATINRPSTSVAANAQSSSNNQPGYSGETKKEMDLHTNPHHPRRNSLPDRPSNTRHAGVVSNNTTDQKSDLGKTAPVITPESNNSGLEPKVVQTTCRRSSLPEGAMNPMKVNSVNDGRNPPSLTKQTTVVSGSGQSGGVESGGSVKEPDKRNSVPDVRALGPASHGPAVSSPAAGHDTIDHTSNVTKQDR